MWENLGNQGKIGGEGGRILADEEYRRACRITCEELASSYVITCGIYGRMVHTVYCGREVGEIYDEMKRELARFIDSGKTGREAYQFYEYFTKKY